MQHSKIINTFIFICAITTLFSQENKTGIYYNMAGEVFVKSDKQIFLYIATDSSQTPQMITPSKKGNSRKSIVLDKHGTHQFKHWNTNSQTHESYTIYSDGIKPVTKYTEDVYQKQIVRDTLFYGKDLKVTLSANDEMSKVNNTFYQIDNSQFLPYTDTISINKEGTYIFSYYSIDNVGNIEDIKKKEFSVDITPPKSNYSILGVSLDTVLSLKSILKLDAEDNFSGVKDIFYQIDEGKWHKYNNQKIPLEGLEDDEHTLKYYAVDEVGNKETEQSLNFYFDISAPLVSLIALGDKFVLQGRVYFSGRTKLILLALDNKAGLKEIMYSIDNKPFEPYKDAFYLPPTPGFHNVKYYARDKVDNKGVGKDEYSIYEQVSDMFFVDLLGPNISSKFIGPYIERDGQVYVCNETKIIISAKDKEAGIKQISYSVDTDTAEIEYKNNVELNFEEGSHRINAIAYDNVNNRNILPIEFITDTKGPVIFEYFSIKSVAIDTIPVVPSYSNLYLAANDAMTGTGEIKYSINDGDYRIYRKPISGLLKNKLYKVDIIATDKLRNISNKTFYFKTLE